MNTKLLIAGAALMIAATIAMADDAEYESGSKPLSFNVAILKPTGDHVKRSAIRAMLNRSWKVDKVGDSFVEGSIKEQRIRVDFDAAHNVKISGANGTSTKWLKNLYKDIWVELSFCGGV